MAIGVSSAAQYSIEADNMFDDNKDIVSFMRLLAEKLDGSEKEECLTYASVYVVPYTEYYYELRSYLKGLSKEKLVQISMYDEVCELIGTLDRILH